MSRQIRSLSREGRDCRGHKFRGMPLVYAVCSCQLGHDSKVNSEPLLTIRQATPEDSLAVARVHLAAWRAAYRGIIPDSYLDALDEGTRASRYTFDRNGPDDPLTWIALEGGHVRGFVTLGPARDGEQGQGEIIALYVSPLSWRSGVGTVLLAHAERHLVPRGLNEALLWVLKDNSRGRLFYEARGWQCDAHELTAPFDGHEVLEARYSKSLRGQ